LADQQTRENQRKEALLRQAAEQRKRAENERSDHLRRVRTKIAEMASPEPSITADGRLNAGPNAIYDAPQLDDDLPTLPIREQALIRTILAGLPRNAHKELIASLENYAEELNARGVRPILGLLQDMAQIIEADVGSQQAAREWLDPGTQKAFERFASNHASFLANFPLDPERERLYSTLSLDENRAFGRPLRQPFEAVAKAALEANRAGLATDDFLKIVDRLADYAKAVSAQVQEPAKKQRATETEPSPPGDVTRDDKTSPGLTKVSVKRRVILSGVGFFERAYNLAGSTASLASTPPGLALLSALRDAVVHLVNLVGL
jgi:hypothetical protein